MKLEDFIAETLKEIVNGVRTAQRYAAQHGAIINPESLTYRSQDKVGKPYESRSGRFPEAIDFDVAVTTTEGTETSGGVGVFVGPLGLGSRGKSITTDTSMSRIKFSVQVLLPVQSDESSAT